MSDEQRSRGGDIAIARYVPPVSVPDMERMAHAVVASGMYGIKSVPQALTLMLISQAEGRHPILAARDYDLIQTGNTVRPAKKSEAMMRDFISHHGSVEWHEVTDTACEATWSHPYGGEVRIRWDMEKARQAGLANKDNWRKYPRAMLRARCTAEGIRTVCPMATSGMHIPEEVADIEPRPRRMKDVTPAPEQRQPLTEYVDNDTGEIRVALDPLLARARDAADKGTELLRAWLRNRSPDDRAALRDAIGTAEQPGELLLLAQQADRDAQQERLRTPPAATPSPPQESASEAPAATEIPADGSPPERRPSRPAAARTSAGPPPRSTIWGDDSFAVPLHDAHGGPDWERWVGDMAFLCEEATTPELEQLQRDNKDTIQRLKVSDSTRYRALLHEFERGRDGRPE